MNTLVLTIDLAEGVHPDEVATDLNAAILCRLEEDDKTITGWRYAHNLSDNYVVRCGNDTRSMSGSLYECALYIQAHTGKSFTIEKE
jgi:hypothetical protein